MPKLQQEGCNGCCPGPMGQQGIQGNQGPQGVPGPEGSPGHNGLNGKDGKDGLDGLPGKNGKDGLDGLPGPKGNQGNPGEMGPMGPQGLQGPKGDCVECPCNCGDPEFAEVYSNQNQLLAASSGLNLAGGIVKLENTIFATSNIDVSQAGLSGKIMINKAGWYDVATGICGALNPIPSPIPVWTLSLFLNGILVNGSTFANQTISPEQKSNEIVADVFVHFNKGDVLELANTSINPLQMSSPTLGTNAQPSSAYLKIILLKAD